MESIDYIPVSRDQVKLWRVAQAAGDHETLGNIYIHVEQGNVVIAAAASGTAVVEKRSEPIEGQVSLTLREYWLQWRFAKELHRISVNTDELRIFADRTEIWRDDMLFATVPVSDQEELPLASYPDVSPFLSVRKEAKRIYIDAGKLSEVAAQFVMPYHSKSNPPRVWLEINEADQQLRISTDRHAVHKIRAAVMPLRAEIKDDVDPDQLKLT